MFKLSSDVLANFRGVQSALRELLDKIADIYRRLRYVEEAVKTIPTMGGSGSTSSGGNSVLATVDFGASFTHYTSVSVAATWVAADSEIVVTPLAVAGQEIEYTLMSFSPVVSDLSAGVGFTLHVYTPIEAKGTYQFSCVGV